MATTLQTLPYSILELATVAAGHSPAESLRNALDLARHAETLGYTRFWLAEHHNMVSIASSAPAVLIGYIAAGTQKLKVGSGGIMLPNHSPLIVAEQFGTLGSLYPGRIDLGLGRAPGTDQITAHAIRSDRMRAVHQFPDEVSQIQQFFSPDNNVAQVRATVAEGVDVPVYILGSSTDSAHLAAKKGLPYAFASHFAPALLHEALAIYRKEFQPSPYLQAPYTIACINTIVADTDEEADRLSTSLIRMMYGVLTSQLDYLQPPTDMTEDLHELSQHPAFRRMLQYAYIGSKETVKEKTAEFLAQTGIDEVMVVSHLYDHQARIKSFKLFSELMREE